MPLISFIYFTFIYNANLNYYLFINTMPRKSLLELFFRIWGVNLDKHNLFI